MQSVHDTGIDLQPWMTSLQAVEPRLPPAARLAWAGSRQTPTFCIDLIQTQSRHVDLGVFSAALRNAKLFDNRDADLPGAVIVLPLGMQLLNAFRNLVRTHYVAAGLSEYDYPLLGSLDGFARFDRVFPSSDKVLCVGTRADFDKGSPRAIVLPTGEPVVYAHWRKLVRHVGDLPIEMFRHTRFLRPWSKTSGAGIFHALEGTDMFEFHGCYAREHAPAAGAKLFTMLQKLITDLAVPVVWSTRPPWSNHHQVSNATIGGDAPLPSGASLQIATLYNQGDIFSRAFDIRYKTVRGDIAWPCHVVGALSRRLLMVHLLMGLRTDGSFVVHPQFSPDQVHLLLRPTSLDSGDDLLMHARALQARGLRLKTTVASTSKQLASVFKHSVGAIAPIILIVQGRRDNRDSVRAVVRRTDDLGEIALSGSDLANELPPVMESALVDVESAYVDRIARYFASRLVRVESASEARDVLSARKIVLAALSFNQAAVAQVAAWQQGEVLGFVDSAEIHPCIVSRRPTATVAYVSPRA